MNSKLVLAIFLSIVLLSTVNGEQVDIDGVVVELSRDANNSASSLTIKPGEEFNVHAILKNADRDGDNVEVYLRIYINDVLVYDRGKYINTNELEDYELIVSSDRFLDIWDETFMSYECKTSEVKVEAYGDVPNNVDTAELKIEGVKWFDEARVIPPDPDKNDLIFVYVEDWLNESDIDDFKEGADPLEDAYVKIINLEENQQWDKSDDFDGFRTDDDGFVRLTISKQREFMADPYGKYLVLILEKKSGKDYGNYCRFQHSFTIGHYINISIEPENPREGEPVKVKVLDDENVSVPFVLLTVSGPQGMVLQTTTNENGETTLIINGSGIHSINALREGCEECANSVSKWFEVVGKGKLKLDVNPKKVMIGDNVVMVASNDKGKNIDKANVIIVLPNGTSVTGDSTNRYGFSSYTPKEAGEYKIIVKKTTYRKATESFRAFNSFQIESQQEIQTGKKHKVTVRNQMNEPVSGTDVYIDKLNTSRLNLTVEELYKSFLNYTTSPNETSPYYNISHTETDLNGSFNLLLDESGFYRIGFSKKGYMNKTVKVTAVNRLSLKLSSNESGMGESITVAVFDLDDNPLNASIKISDPRNKVKVIEGCRYEYSPPIPGDYVIEASREGYSTDRKNLSVAPYPVDLDARVEGNYLVIKAGSGDKPLTNIKIEIITPDNKRVDTYTDEEGVVNLDLAALDRRGNFTLRVNSRNYGSKEMVKEITSWGGFDFIGLIPWFMGGVFLALISFLGYRFYEKKEAKKRMKRLRKIRRRR
ncbi:MAG: hypothetical protein U9M95_00575 [Candidatus Altiarchaeota archaeon]|nr:hypothetical protein [Candidatus Altiarchaeota archaeon]